MEWSYILLGAILFIAVSSYGQLTFRLGRLEKKINLLLVQSGIDPNISPALSEKVQEIARDPSRKIEAIKAYREETGVGLAEAKEAVEEFMRGSNR
jgi:hypothetical protein